MDETTYTQYNNAVEEMRLREYPMLQGERKYGDHTGNCL